MWVSAPQARSGETARAAQGLKPEALAQFLDGESGRSCVSRLLQLTCPTAAKVAFDDGPAERANVVRRRLGTLGRAHKVGLRLELFRPRQEQEQLVVEAERQRGCRVNLVGKCRRDHELLSGEYVCRNRDDDGSGREGCAVALDSDQPPAVVDPLHAVPQADGQRLGVGLDEPSVARFGRVSGPRPGS